MMTSMQLARLAGAIYLLQTFVGSFPIYVRSQLISQTSGAETVEGILTAESLFRFGMLSEVGVSITWFLIAFVLFCLFRRSQLNLSALFFAMTMIGIAAITTNVVHLHGAFELLSGGVATGDMSEEQIQSLTMILLSMFSKGEAAWALWAGLWLIPLGLVVWKTAAVPRVFGLLLMVASLGYILPITASYVAPELAAPLRYLIFLSGPVELSWGLWLLIRGVDQTRLETEARAPDGLRSF